MGRWCGRRRAGREEAISVCGPGAQARRIARSRLAKRLAADQLVPQRIGRRLRGPAGRPGLGRFLFPAHLDRGRSDRDGHENRSEEHTSELQSLMRISYAVFCLKKKKTHKAEITTRHCTS